MFEATTFTFSVAQINFIILLLFLLFWRNRERIVGGIWLAIGIMLKPVLVIVLMYPFLRKHWRTFIGVIVASVVMSGITIMTFGSEMFFGYFSKNPIVLDMPNYMYTEAVNQSLLATMLRITNFSFGTISPYLYPPFIIAALLLTCITSFLVFSKKGEGNSYSDFALALTITFSLLLFPKTLTHYAVLLTVPIIMILTRFEQVNINFWHMLVFITIEFVFVSLDGNFVFISILLAWMFLAAICLISLFIDYEKK
jgi:hypothetical protein